MPLTTHPVTLQTTLPGGTLPLEGTWTLTVAADPAIFKDADGVVQASRRELGTTGGLLVLTLPATGQTGLLPADGRWRLSFRSEDKTMSLGPYVFALTAPMTLKDLAEVTGVSITPSMVEQVTADAAQVALDRVAVEAVGTTNDTIIAGRVNDPASATRGSLDGAFAGKVNPAFTSAQPLAPFNPATPGSPTGVASPALRVGDAEIRAAGTNNAIGRDALQSNTTGSSNNAIGRVALQNNTTGSSNNALGHVALINNTTGGSNNAIGRDALQSNTAGSSNNALGHGALHGPRGNTAWATTTASQQTATGHESGQGAATQVDQISVYGYRAISAAVRGTALGANSGVGVGHDGSVALGSDTATTAAGQVMVGPRDVEVTDSAKGVVLKSPDGTRYRIKVANGGALTATAV